MPKPPITDGPSPGPKPPPGVKGPSPGPKPPFRNGNISGLTRYVNTFIGTDESDTSGGHSGNNNPGAQTPFGMVIFSPDTPGSGRLYGPGSGGYYYRNSNIRFFSMTHLNGPGCRAQGAVALMPWATSTDNPDNTFSHGNESSSPGYYRVTTANGVTTELTATTRTGMARFTFAAGRDALLVLDPRQTNAAGGS